MKQLLSAKVANHFAPRLLVLLLDLTITILAFICAWALRFNVTIEPANWHWNHFFGLLGCRLVLFLWIRPFAGVIRHTGVEDALLVGRAVSLSSLLAAVGSYALKVAYKNPLVYIPISILVIEYFISMVLLVSIRFTIKYLYQLLIAKPVSQARPVLIYGAGALGIHTKEVINRDPDYRILGFIDDNSSKTQKTVHGIQVFSPHEAAGLFLTTAIRPEVILAINNLPVDRRNKIADFLLQHQVVVKVVPSMQDWINGQLSSGQIRDIRIDDLLGRPAIQLNNKAIIQFVRGRVAMVTGAAGSIGSELVCQLLHHQPKHIIVLDQAESALYDLVFKLKTEFRELVAATTLTGLVADVTDTIRLRSIFEQYRPEFVFHAAAYKHVPLMEEQPYEAVKVNVLGTKAVADASVLFDVEKFILISTDKAVNPTNVMGATKRFAEMYVQSLNGSATTDFIITRFGNVLGSNGSVVPTFKRQIEMNGPVTVTHPDIIRYFMTIPEACQLVLEAAAMGNSGEVFVFDMGQPIRIADLARQMIRLSGYEVDKQIKLEFTGLRPGEKLYEELLHTDESVLPTHHPKIRIARLLPPDKLLIQQAFLQFTPALLDIDQLQLVRILKEAVPEYISNNSPYSSLDVPTAKVDSN
ncbi:nucleoside-diphosphate sugar epimerase/dehydratase [Spirosoma sp. SC4-14]|uniref:polysaccharide biosynthesis protein n=1 Tax=Spirosoma sp. SC4-14 TaxID=3128900 RepID=UPI0030CA5CCB